MAITYTYYPEYRKIVLAKALDSYSAGTDLGIKCCYDTDLTPIPVGTDSLSESAYVQYYKVGWISPLNNTLQTYSNIKPWILINPFTNPLRIYNLNTPVISTLPDSGTTYSLCKILATEGNQDLCIFVGVEKTGYQKALRIYINWYNQGSVPTTTASSIGLVNLASSTSDNDAISLMNSVLSNMEVYVGSFTNYSLSDSSRRIGNHQSIQMLVKYQNSYMYGMAQVGDYATVTNETVNVYGPEPEPTPPTPSTDPYSAGGYSSGGGGGGDFDTSSDDIPIPPTPTDIASSTGLFTAYNPSFSQLASLSSAIWNKDPSTFDDWWRFFFGGDAFNAIIGLSMIPTTPVTSGNKEIYLGKWGTGVSAPKISNQYKQVNFGSLILNEFWGNAIDYSPYTRIQLALPYLGIVDVDTDDVIASVNTLSYNIDVYTGACTAMLSCQKGELNSVIYEWTGNVAAVLPVTGSSFSALTTGLIATAISAASTASGVSTALAGSASMPVASMAALAGSALSTFGSNKGKIQRSGNFSGNSGALGIQTPYFIISRPVQSVPSTQQATKGYPANISAHLGDLLGYTEIIDINLHGLNATEEEMIEIKELLKKGVIF